MDNYELTEEMIKTMLAAADKASKLDPKADRKDLFLIKSIENLYNMALTTGTFGHIDPDGDPIRCLRVVRCRRPIPKDILNYTDGLRDGSGIYEKVFCSGLYVALPAVHIPKSVLQKCMISYRRGCMYTLNIPEINDLHVSLATSTLRLNSDGSAIVLESSPFTNVLCAGSHYQMLEIY